MGFAGHLRPIAVSAAALGRGEPSTRRGNIFMNDDRGLWIMCYAGKQPAPAPAKPAAK